MLYVCSTGKGPGDSHNGGTRTIWAFDVQGTKGVNGRIRLPEVCANLCFGGPKRNQLFMTASQSVYMFQVNTQGAAPG
jgi:gluconolactonase